MQPIDFTGLPKRNKAYAGANGDKISVIYEGEQYMLKFPAVPKRNDNMSYCQRQYEIVRKRRRNFVVFRRGCG